MGITVDGHAFDGPHTDSEDLENRSGVYVLGCRSNGGVSVIDVGESADIRMRIETHDRKACWGANCSGEIAVYVLYTPGLQQAGRMEIEQRIREEFSPPCGER